VAYNSVGAIRLDGRLDTEALRGALAALVERHEALRTVFGFVDGAPVQQVLAGTQVALRVEDLRHVDPAEWSAETERQARREQARPFDLAAGPLLRTTLLRLAPERHVLLLCMHHVITDGWSRGVMVAEISALYAALAGGGEPALAPLPVQYADYAVWQRERLRGGYLAELLDYWTGRLAGAPPALTLPTDHPRPALQSFVGRTHTFRLPHGVGEPLRALAREEGATLYMVLLAAFNTLLARYTGQADLVVGTPVANRERRETEGLVGFFANTLALRTDLSGDPTFREALGRVRDTVLGALAHQELPFERLVEALHPDRSLSRNQVFQVAFLVDDAPLRAFRLPGLELAPVEVETGTSIFDLTFGLADDGDGLVGRLEYVPALWDAATIERMAEHFGVLVSAIAASPDARLAALPLISPPERALLERWNDTDRGYPSDLFVHDLFAAQAARTPGAPALVFRGETVSYADLDRRANRLANHLRGLGVAPETRVGVSLERTPELVVALLAVLKAGGAYVPLDPAYPRERLGYMTEDADVLFVLTTSSLAERLPPDVEPVCIDEIRAQVESASPEAPLVRVLPDNLSHVIFTSGSTGRPKGVMIRHASTAILVHWMLENVSDEERASVLGATSINFDVSVAEIFGTLCWGGKLVLVENALELPAVADQEIRYASMVPTAAAELLRSGGIPPTVRTLNLGGEALPNDLAQALYAAGTVDKVGNLYGPTEDTTYSTYSVVGKGADRVLVGRLVANTRAYVLDEMLRPVPVGIIGELYLAGDGLSRGYAGRPDLTAERFIPCPFGAPGGRMYRVMDRIRWTEGGELEYFGRTDFQVKVRGFRIELGEIEGVLSAHPAVGGSVVTAWDDGTGERRLVAYVTAGAGAGAGAGLPEAAAASELRRWVGERLPDYMVPSLFVPMDALPLTPNGKVDRRALPDPGASRAAPEAEYAPPRNDVEGTISEVWREVLGVERVGIRDNFFELGGTSVRLAAVQRLVAERLERPVTVLDLFRYPTVAGLAEFLGSDGEGDGGGARRRDEVHDRAERQRQAQQTRQQQRNRGRR
jgi:amino acid adenylation domain-containing protein